MSLLLEQVKNKTCGLLWITVSYLFSILSFLINHENERLFYGIVYFNIVVFVRSLSDSSLVAFNVRWWIHSHLLKNVRVICY
jgi:hypothetical protein